MAQENNNVECLESSTRLENGDGTEAFLEKWKTFDAFQAIERVDPISQLHKYAELKHVTCSTSATIPGLEVESSHVHAAYATRDEQVTTESFVLMNQHETLSQPLREEIAALNARVAALQQVAMLKRREAQLSRKVKSEQEIDKQV